MVFIFALIPNKKTGAFFDNVRLTILGHLYETHQDRNGFARDFHRVLTLVLR